MDRLFTYVILLLNLFLAIRFFIKKNNEVPFFLALFNLMVEYRVMSLESGDSKFVSYDYGIAFIFSMEYAYIASKLILLGSSIMIYSYMFFYKPAVRKTKDSNEFLKFFINKKKKQIIIGLCFFSLLSLALRGSNTGGYAFLIKLGNSSFILMLFLIIVFADKRTRSTKLLYAVLFLFLSYLTYSPALRFQFLGWMIPIGYFVSRNVKPSSKIFLSIAGIFIIMIVFSVAGTLREASLKSMSANELLEASIKRLKKADDVNFIDGFMMLYQVYPELLNYGYGLQHVEILLRPIPRALWPNKPQASWVRKYQEKYSGKVLQSAGFSPTIWGVFYSELGFFGILGFSIFWAWLLAYVYRAFSVFNSDLSAILIGVMLASLIPIFRSGDMAGDFAIVLMSFWPLIIFVRMYKKFLRKYRVYVV